MATLHLVIESILRQSVKLDKVVLYLTKSQVPDVEKLSRKLLDCRKRGLEIKLCDDEIRSHTKYFYAMQEFPDDIVITVDDDLFYRSDLVATHLMNAEKYPGCVIANWVKRIIPGKTKYTEWPDGSGASRIMPFVNTITKTDFSKKEIWVGKGTAKIDSLWWIKMDRKIGVIDQYGLIGFIISMLLVYRCMIRRFISIESLFFLGLLGMSIGNIYYAWGCLTLFAGVRYFQEQKEQGILIVIEENERVDTGFEITKNIE